MLKARLRTVVKLEARLTRYVCLKPHPTVPTPASDRAPEFRIEPLTPVVAKACVRLLSRTSRRVGVDAVEQFRRFFSTLREVHVHWLMQLLFNVDVYAAQ